jgi:hypothetical protein
MESTAPMIGTIAAPGMLNLRKLHDILPQPTFPASKTDDTGTAFYDAMAALGVRNTDPVSAPRTEKFHAAQPSLLAFERPMYVPPPDHATPAPPGLHTAAKKVRPAVTSALNIKKGGISELITAVRAELAAKSTDAPPAGMAKAAAGAGYHPPTSTPVPAPPSERQFGRRKAPHDREYSRPEWWG